MTTTSGSTAGPKESQSSSNGSEISSAYTSSSRSQESEAEDPAEFLPLSLLQPLRTRMGKVKDYLNLTKELEAHGEVRTFMTNSRRKQKVERMALEQLHDTITELEEIDQAFLGSLKFIYVGKPKEVGDMDYEVLVKLVEAATGKKVEDMFDVLMGMTDIQGSDIGAVVQREKQESELWSPNSAMSASTVATSKYGRGALITPMPAGVSGSYVFPSASQMIANNGQVTSTPAQSVFQFGNGVLSTQTKQARLLKPGEGLFSVSGSPLMMPKFAGIDRKAERIPVNDPDGKKVVEVVLYKGDEEKTKQYKEFVTTIRGIAATRSTIKERVLPPRFAGKGGTASAKKPDWH